MSVSRPSYRLQGNVLEEGESVLDPFVELWQDCDPKLRLQVIQFRQMAQGRD